MRSVRMMCVLLMGVPALAWAAWTFEGRADPMGGSKTRIAWTRSSNFHQLPFPYQGRTHATLILRYKEGQETQVRLDIDRSQFICHSECPTRVRFDEAEAEGFPAVPPADYSYDTIFIEREEDFIQKALAAKRVRIEVQMFQAGTRVFEFDVRGLAWPPPERRK